MINKKDEDLKEGLTIQDIIPFFERYRIPLKVLDTLYSCKYRYDPPVKDKHYPVMYVFCKGDHVYACNLQVASNGKKIEEEKVKHEKDMYISNNFKTYEKEDEDLEPVHFMINNINDLVDILRNNSDKYEELNVVHINDDLKDLFYQLKHIGYSPMMRFGAGTMNSSACILKKSQTRTFDNFPL